jgi:hypothetical protein
VAKEGNMLLGKSSIHDSAGNVLAKVKKK